MTLPDLLAMRQYSSSLFGKTSRKVKCIVAGGYKSPFKGRGMEFDQVRAYQHGDDTRTIDWRVTARRGAGLYTKMFQEERERPMYIITDLRPRMHFGTRVAYKSVIAARLAAAIAWAGLEQGDKIGGAVMSASGYSKIPPERSQKQVLRLLGLLRDGCNEDGTRKSVTLSEAMAALRKSSRHGGIVFVISDFHDLDEKARQHLGVVAGQLDVFLISILDPLEVEPPPPGVYRISDSAGRHEIVLPAEDKHWRKAYTDMFAQKRREFIEFCQSRKITPAFFKTTDRIADFNRILTQHRKGKK